MRFIKKSSRLQNGFTLVEVLVVIAIIAVLAALTVGAVMRTTDAARLSNTRSMLGTINKTLKEHWNYVVAEARKETAPPGVLDAVFGPDPTGGERNKVIWVKLRLMEAFPVSFNELSLPPNNNISFFPYRNVPGAPTGIIPQNMRKYMSTYQNTLGGKASKNPATESSACLLMALSMTRNGTALGPDILSSSFVTDTDGDGMKEFVDAWGNPLIFFRYPTQNPVLQASKPAVVGVKAKYADPLDPDGALFNWPAAGVLGNGRTLFQNNVHIIGFYNPNIGPPLPNAPLNPFPTPAPKSLPGGNYLAPAVASYIVPTIVSAGPTGNSGLDTQLNTAASPNGFHNMNMDIQTSLEAPYPLYSSIP